jgi:2-keto-4-pentenoate hydratase/2-oxohepta-3-ene-1,7-dioic acid hydratase in catechol pathway
LKLATFEQGHGPELGLVKPAGVLPLSRTLPGLGGEMAGLIAAWPLAEPDVRACDADEAASLLPLHTITFLAPVPRPGKILAIGLNYADHIAEAGMPTPERQLWFAKMSTSAHGPYAVVQIPRVSTQVDYEAEMVAVIGKGGRHIPKSEAPSAIFGYCVGNDVTARDWQLSSPQWTVGKSFDTHGPFGPWITTADEVGDPHNLAIRGYVNDELRQESNTRRLVFDVYDQVEHLSQAMTLEPGDILFTGTPGGVGIGLNTFLQPGDRVRVEVEKLGAIDNLFASE